MSDSSAYIALKTYFRQLRAIQGLGWFVIFTMPFIVGFALGHNSGFNKQRLKTLASCPKPGPELQADR